MNKTADTLAAALRRAVDYVPTTPAASKPALDAQAARVAIATHTRARAAMRRASGFAWVSSATPQYVLHVSSDAPAAEFRCLDSIKFDNFKAAQAIANAIRAHIAGA